MLLFKVPGCLPSSPPTSCYFHFHSGALAHPSVLPAVCFPFHLRHFVRRFLFALSSVFRSFEFRTFSSTAGKTKRPLAVSPAVLMSSLGSFRRFGNVRLGFVLHRHKTVAALIFALINAIDIFGLGEHVVRFAFPFSSLPLRLIGVSRGAEVVGTLRDKNKYRESVFRCQ